MAKNIHIKQTILSNIYTKQIFKILYTTVFCCESPHFKECEDILEEIMQSLVNSVFNFSPHPVDKQRSLKVLQYGQVTFNLKDFLSDLTINLSSVQLFLVQRFINHIDDGFLQRILAHFNKLRQNQLYEEYCEGVIYIYINVLKFLETFKLSVNTKFNEKDKIIKEKIQGLLCKHAICISSKLNYLIEFLGQKNNKTVNYSSGQKIEVVGLLKYRILELIEKIFSINQIENLKIDFKSFDFFPILQMFLQRFKWNSIAHNLLFKIIQHLMSQDYENFRKRYIQTVQNHNKGLFGHLISHFRNRKFVFLHSMHMINQGHRSLIFKVSKTLISEMQQRNDLNKLLDGFKIWRHFMLNDLKDYEAKNYEISQCFDSQHLQQMDHSKQQVQKFNSTSTPSLENSSHKPLQTIEQILIHFKQEQKWSPKHNPNKMRKQNFLNNESIKKIDSMAQYLPPND